MDRIQTGVALAASFFLAAVPRTAEASLLGNMPVASADYHHLPLPGNNPQQDTDPTNTPLPSRRIECPQGTVRKVRERYPR